MWVVFISAPYEGTWGHRYFRYEDSAQKYYCSLVEDLSWAGIHVNIQELLIED